MQLKELSTIEKINKIREDFPIFSQQINGKPLAYLDNAATTQKPIQVLDQINRYYKKFNANPHRGAYTLSIKATNFYNMARKNIKRFINAKHTEEIIFTRGATEALNLIAYSYGMNFINEGDEIVLSIAEHHSNLVPWQQIALAKKAKLIYLYTDENGQISKDEINKKITNKTKLVAIAQVSNVLGTVFPVEHIIKIAHKHNAVVVLDMAQSIPHIKADVQELDVDFAVFSGHKMLAPMGIGVLYGKKDLLIKMPPFLFGGDMIDIVKEQSTTFAPLPQKFEAGTQNVGGAIGLSAAIDYLENIGYDNIYKIEKELTSYALNKLSQNPNISIFGSKNGDDRTGVISFTVKDVHPHDVSTILDADGIAIRSGHHCAHPLMTHCKTNATCRASLYFYNTFEEIDRLAESLLTVRKWLGFDKR